jgi:peptidoglycan/LPS O-acetylase OafA/YrhL
LVIALTILASYKWLGFLVGDDTARVGKAATLFYANIHFIAAGTNYWSAQQPPSPLQNYWSLSVEEQFYLVYPTLFIVAALSWGRVSLRLKLTVLLCLSIVASFAWSVHQTAVNGIAAYFSPFTRAWELALGGLVAVGSLQLAKLPRYLSTGMTWVGLGGILLAATTFSSTTPYPGSAVALPVIATALVVAGGASRPRLGAEVLLRPPPVQWMGRLSYSLYLWHWPILVIAEQAHIGPPLSMQDKLLLVLVALGLSVMSYLLVENPIRHWAFLVRSATRSIALGAILIGLSLAVATFELASHP